VLLVCLGGGLYALYEIAKRPRAYSYEQASRDLAADGVREVVFAFDNPATPVLKDSTLEALGGFFFHRERQPVLITPVRLRDDDDASATLLAHAQSPKTGLLWVYDLKMRGTAAARNTPHIEQLDPRWRCKDYGKDNIGVIVCTQAVAVAATR